MTHKMNLNQIPFKKIREGAKTIELRLYDEKRRRIKVGDNICFKSKSDNLTVTVKALHIFKDFKELYAALPLDKCGYSNDEVATASPDDMLAYYTKGQIDKYGVVGIEIEVKKIMLGKRVKVTVDRPLGTCHPEHEDLYYPVNYGYVEGIIAPDGEEQDAYILGVDKPVSEFEGIVIAIIHRLNDVEDKWVVASGEKLYSKSEIKAEVNFQEQFFDYEIITTEIKIYPYIEDEKLSFAVIAAKTDGKWVFCKHRERDTYEFPGGHKEDGEMIIETARRELYEETGATDFFIKRVCYYSVKSPDMFDGKETFGLFYYAEIREFEKELHSEIEKIIITDELPENWTYPLIQSALLGQLKNRRYNE